MKKQTSKKQPIIIISAPSGTGKSTIIKGLLKEIPILQYCASVTTRKPRPTEQNNIDYIFISYNEFQSLIKQNKFLEYARVFDNYYGTLKDSVNSIINNGKIAILDIDVQGVQNIQKSAYHSALYLFILPPSTEELIERLKKRNTSPDVIQRRLKEIDSEIQMLHLYDYIFINQNLNECINEIKNVISKEFNLY